MRLFRRIGYVILRSVFPHVCVVDLSVRSSHKDEGISQEPSFYVPMGGDETVPTVYTKHREVTGSLGLLRTL